MNIIWQLTKRNTYIYFRNKMTVFFSLFAMFIIIGLYALFLGDMQVQNLKQSIEYQISDNLAEWLINSWIMGGIIIVNIINVTLAALGVMVEDKEKKKIMDLVVAPIKRSHIVISYILASIIIGIIMGTISFALAEIYIHLDGGHILPLITIIKVLISIIFSVVMSSSMFFILFTFINKENAVGTIASVVGTLIGFLTGIYIPVGVMPIMIQKGIKLFPFTYSAVMFKNLFTTSPIKEVFANAPSEALAEYNRFMGNIISIQGHVLSYSTMLGIVGISSIIFIIIAIIRIRYQRNY